MNETTFAVVFTLLCIAGLALLKLASWWERRTDAADAAADITAVTPVRFVDPTPDEPEANLVQIGGDLHHIVPIVPGSTEPELVDELPVRAQAIEVPREGAVKQDRWRPHTRCVDAWADREPSRICRECAPVFGIRVGAS